jgi:two-component system, cell cycle sensor histidine kinase and response regulator CckA
MTTTGKKRRGRQAKNGLTDNASLEARRSLRHRAETLLAASTDFQDLGADEEKDRLLIHELRLHHIELEIQNDELRASQETLATSEARYLDLYDFAPVGYVTVNKAGIIVESNHTAAVLLQMPPGSLVKEPFFRFILPDDQDIYYRRHKESFITNKPQTCKVRLLRKHSRPFWARLESGPLRDEGANSKVCRMAVIDIDAGVRAANDKLHQGEKDRQLQKAESLTRLSGAIAHHLNNMLTVISRNLELAMGESPQGTPLRESLDAAMEGVDRLKQLSGSILTSLGGRIGKHQLLNVSELCHQTLVKLRIPPQVEVRVDFPAIGPMITANPEQLSEMMTHILTNGLDSFVNGKGVLTLTVTTGMAKDISERQRFPLDWHPKNCLYASIAVTDNGCGIDNTDIENLFDPFFTKKFFGRGMGLSIVLGIVRAHGGAVTVGSAIGSGTAFQVFLPMSPLEHCVDRP